MKRKIFLVAFISLLMKVSTTAQSNQLIKYLPENTVMLIGINMGSLGSKIPPETFHQSFIYRELTKKPNPELMNFLSNPSESGVDFSKDFFLVFDNDTATTGEEDTNIKNGLSSFHLFGMLKNEVQFTGTIKNLIDSNSMATYGTNKILVTGNSGMSLGWNHEIFVLNAGNGSAAMTREVNRIKTDSTIKDFDLRIKEMIGKIQRDLCFKMLTPHPSNSFCTDTEFLNFVKIPADIRTWSKGMLNPFLNNILPRGMMAQKFRAINSQSRTAIMNFENGKISVHGRFNADSSVQKVYKNFNPAPLSAELISRLPEGKLLALMQVFVNPSAAADALEKSAFSGIMDSLLQKLPVDLELLTSAFRGSMMMAVIKPDSIAADDSITHKMGGLQIIAAMTIADKPKFEELKKSMSTVMDSIRKKNEGKDPLKGFHPYLNNNDEFFIISSSPYAGASFFQGTRHRVIPGWFPVGRSLPFVMGLNLGELIRAGIYSNKKEGAPDPELEKMISMFDHLIMYGGNMENNQLQTNMEFRFRDTEKNAMTQLFEFLNMAGEINERKKSAENENRQNEGTKDEGVKLENIKIEEIGNPPPPPPPLKPPGVKIKPVKKTKGY